MKLILLGAPGSGKGTQATAICAKYNLPHISTGDIFREHMRKNTPLGLKIKEVMDSGHFCPDELTVDIIKDRLSKDDCKNGYLLDGFPRNIFQAKELDKFSSPDKVIEINVDFESLERRILGRRGCPKCNGTFHVDNLGGVNICPFCGSELIRRADDNPETVKERISVYKEKTMPLIDYYFAQNKLFRVNGNLKVEDVFTEIEKALL